jgi:hypothetical protein
VGNGESIKIAQDNWIPGIPSGTFTTLEELPENTKFSFLLNDQATTWNMEKIHLFFLVEMVKTIQQIPISCRGGEDFVSWPHEKLGMYSVESAYHLARTHFFFSKRRTKNQGGASVLSGQEKNWKLILNIVSPNKMKIIVWRMAHECLPSGF